MKVPKGYLHYKNKHNFEPKTPNKDFGQIPYYNKFQFAFKSSSILDCKREMKKIIVKLFVCGRHMSNI